MRVTLWFTVAMVILSAVIFLFIALISNSAASSQIRGVLTSMVEGNTQEVEYDDGELDIDDDFVYFKNGVYCLIFQEDGDKVGGNAPYEELEDEAFEDDVVRAIEVNGETYLIYDRLVEFKRHEDLWIRGVVAQGNGTWSKSAIYRAVLIALPLLIILAAVGGYFIARSSLRPIQQISKTAEEIGNSGDLSKRIEMEPGGDELHQLACTFNRMFDRLETNFEAERHFTSDASHELRTPVSTILAQCEYAFENANGEDELYQSIGSIQKQGYRMSHIIESLLQFTRMEQQTEKPLLEKVDLSELTQTICREQREISEKNITLQEDLQPGIEIMADSALLGRMLVNLIRNAYRYGRENGTTVVGLRQNEKEITLSVADNGVGIAPQELSKIWNRFYRVDQSRNGSGGAGLGLGLAMVKQIAQLYGGSVHVDSEPGKGSVFTVKFAV